MSRKLLVALLGLALLFTSSVNAPAAVQYWNPAQGGNGHYYELVTPNVTWTDAYLAAQQRIYLGIPGHLATISYEAENSFVASVASGNWVWIGLTDREEEGMWKWIDDPTTVVWNQSNGYSPSGSYTNWAPGEPNEFWPGEDYASMYPSSPFYWNDALNSSNLPNYVVEYESRIPEPGTCLIWLLLVTLALTIAWRRRKRGR